MAHIIADRVQETSTTTGTGAITLAGAVTGFRTFGSVMANGDTVYYTITDQSPSANWEVGIGTWNTGGTLTRTTILASSNANAAVNFTSGALYVFGTYPADRSIYQDPSGDVGVGVANPSATLHIKAGTATAGTAPIKLNSGTLMTAAETGAVEYDGKLQYFTPNGTARALTPSFYFYRKNTATTLASATGNQSIFGLTSGVTVAANTIYEVECEFELTTTGTTSHTESFGFTLATATVTNMGVTINRLSATTTSSALGGYLTAVTPAVVTGALTTAQTVTYRVKGTIAFGTAGSINPVIAFSAAPGGTSTVVLGSWMKLTPIGTTGSNVSIGTWA